MTSHTELREPVAIPVSAGYLPGPLIGLRHVSNDETQKISSLLQEGHRIAFYETPTGPGSVSAHGIRLHDVAQPAFAPH